MTKDKLAELLPEPFKYFAFCGGIIALWRECAYTPDGKPSIPVNILVI